MFLQEIAKTTLDIFKAVNATVWGGVEGAEKVGKILKTGASGADVIIGTSHALEDLACSHYVCFSLDVIGSASSAVGLVLGNISSPKSHTFVTGSITVVCRLVRYYCKKHGTFWGIAIGHGVGKGVPEVVKTFRKTFPTK